MKSTLGDSVMCSHMPLAFIKAKCEKKKLVKKTPTTVFDVNMLKDKIFGYLDVHLLKEVTLLLYNTKAYLCSILRFSTSGIPLSRIRSWNRNDPLPR